MNRKRKGEGGEWWKGRTENGVNYDSTTEIKKKVENERRDLSWKTKEGEILLEGSSATRNYLQLSL